LALSLAERARTLPKTGTFQPYYNATSWDHDDLYRAAREDAIRSRAAVEQLVAEKKSKGMWPRGRYEAKFWLRARWEQATAWAQSLAARATVEDGPPKPPKDIRAVGRWLIYDMWDAMFVDLWLAENLGDYTSIDTYGTFPEDDVQFSKWLDRLRSGYYLRGSDRNVP
jgi:hypothetical protein